MSDQVGKPMTGPLAQSHTSAKPAATGTLVGTRWRLISLNGNPVAATTRTPDITLGADGRAYGTDGCNRVMGTYTLDADKGRLAFGQMASTMMACPDDGGTGQGFARALEMADSYYLQRNRLQLIKARMAPLAEFEAVAPEAR